MAQSGPSPIGPLRTAPTEKFTVNPGFRDWAPTTIAGTTILGGNSSNRGGLFAVDMLTGKVKWTSRPTGNVNPSVATAPVEASRREQSGGGVRTPLRPRCEYRAGTLALPPGKLNALDLDTRTILWSFSRPTAEPNWPFGFVTPVDGGLWVDSYQALVKLQ